MSVSESMRACWEGITKVFKPVLEAETEEACCVASTDKPTEESLESRMEKIQNALNRGASQDKNLEALSAMETVSDAELSKLLSSCARQMNEEKKAAS